MTPRDIPPLTVGMATIDDFDGVYFTITSLMVHHAEAIRDCEIVVVDNHPGSKQGRLLKEWISGNIPKGRYVPFTGPNGTAQARNEVFRQARSAAVLCLDCHVLLAPGAVRQLIDHFRNHPQCSDLLTGPLLTDSGKVAATHQRPQWSNGAWGVWAQDTRGHDPAAEPFEIWQQGMGMFACRRDAWVGFHPQFQGFGGCESYVMEKFRRNGGRVLCCPWLRWTHRFARPHGVPYRVDRQDTLRNYLIGFQELGLDLEPVKQHFAELRIAKPPARRPPRPRTIDCAVVGDPRYGGVQIRGAALAEHLSCGHVPPHQLRELPRTRTLVAIKNGFCPTEIRNKCERLIFDPLDDFAGQSESVDPAEYWLSKFRKLKFDDILATSPACYDAMRAALPGHVQVHLVPHQSDRHINESWRNPHGPVAYSGLGCFVESGLDRINEACRSLGREFVMGTGCEILKDASLALALRLPPYNTTMNRYCKPQIKLENAMAAGMPAVATDCPAATSLHPHVPTVAVDFSAAQLVDAMRRACAEPVRRGAFRDANYLTAMDRILHRSAIVVYTAIFGGYDELRPPRERQPGVQYLCFTDNPRLKPNGWTVRYCPASGDPLMQAKRLKILAHESVDCDMSLWIDGRIELHSLNGAIEQCRADLALTRHPHRDCIYAEAEHCKRVRRGDPRRIDAAIARYKSEGHPPAFGLWRGGVILRKHTPAMARFNGEWWREVSTGTSRDQIALPVVLRRLRMPFDTLPDHAPRFRIAEHR